VKTKTSKTKAKKAAMKTKTKKITKTKKASMKTSETQSATTGKPVVNLEVGQFVRQGDVIVTRVQLDAKARDALGHAPETKRDLDGSLAVARGEVTGHRHRVVQRACSMYGGEGGGGISPLPPVTGQADVDKAAAEKHATPFTKLLLGLHEQYGDPSTPSPEAAVLTSAEVFDLLHEEHAPFTLPPGDYYVTYQREYSPEELRRVLD
jgi:hypothetical protein